MSEISGTVALTQARYPQFVDSSACFFTETAWQTYCFSPEWFADALAESGIANSPPARRREVLFAVCCVESYLLEWVRDEVLQCDFMSLEKYFPFGSRRGIKQRWTEVTKQLASDGRIPETQDFGGEVWARFRTLVAYRDGLVHASSSRPQTTALPISQNPAPSKSTLDMMPPGYAVEIILALISDLHRAVGTSVPTWLVAP